MKTTLISFYTVDGYYDKHAERLRAECAALHVRHQIEPLPDTGSYLANCRMKPRFILETLESLQGPVLWVDVDASILRPPGACAVYEYENLDFVARPVTKVGRVRKWHVGTMWFNYNAEVLRFLRQWVDTEGITDEAALHRLEMAGGMQHLFTDNLPTSYFWIGAGLPPVDTVVQHRLSGHLRKRHEYKLAEDDERKHG